MPLASTLVEAFLANQLAGKRASAASTLMPGVAVIFGLTILIAFLIALLLISGLYLIYDALLEDGFSALGAFGIVNLLVVVAILVLVACIQGAIQRLKESLLGLLNARAPIVSRVTKIGEAFLCGLSPTRRKTMFRSVR